MIFHLYAGHQANTPSCPAATPLTECLTSPFTYTVCSPGDSCLESYCGGCFAKCSPAAVQSRWLRCNLQQTADSTSMCQVQLVASLYLTSLPTFDLEVICCRLSTLWQGQPMCACKTLVILALGVPHRRFACRASSNRSGLPYMYGKPYISRTQTPFAAVLPAPHSTTGDCASVCTNKAGLSDPVCGRLHSTGQVKTFRTACAACQAGVELLTLGDCASFISASDTEGQSAVQQWDLPTHSAANGRQVAYQGCPAGVTAMLCDNTLCANSTACADDQECYIDNCGGCKLGCR